MFPIRDHNPVRKDPLCHDRADRGEPGRLVLNWRWVPVGLIAAASFRSCLSEGEQTWRLISQCYCMAAGCIWAANMLLMWIFGDNLEDEMGPLPFLGFSLLGGVAAALMQIRARHDVAGADGRRLGGHRGGDGRLPADVSQGAVDVLTTSSSSIRILPIPAFIMLGCGSALQVVMGLGTSDSSGRRASPIGPMRAASSPAWY